MNYGCISASITNVCNLRCRMCGSQNMDYKPKAEFMEFDIWKKIINLIPDNQQIELNALGEQTLHPQFLDFIRYAVEAKRDKLFIKLNTNGMWNWEQDQTERLISWLTFLKIHTTMIFNSQIMFSVDGGEKETVEWIRKGVNFNKLIDNINHCLALTNKDNQVIIGIAYTMMKRNMNEIVTLLQKIKGVKQIYLNLLNICTEEMLGDSLYDNYNEYIECAEKAKIYCEENNIQVTYAKKIDDFKGEIKGCSFPFYPWIDPKGNIYLCCMRWDKPICNIMEIDKWIDVVNKGRLMQRTALLDIQCGQCFEEAKSWTWQSHFSNESLFKKYIECK